MKGISNRKPVCRMLLCIVFYALAEIFRPYLEEMTKNGKVGQVVSVFEVILALCFAKILIGELLKKAEASKSGFVKGVLRFLERLVKPLAEEIAEKFARNQKRIFGQDKREVVIPWRCGKKTMNPSKNREKVTLSSCLTNNERIRMLYIARILRLKSSNGEFSSSQTPREIKKRQKCGKDGILFDVYETVRYGRDAVIDDTTTNLCEQCEITK